MLPHYRNLDVMRLIAAASVVFSHSFLIATGSEATEPLEFTGQVAGVYGVFAFFILSGFLVTESARRTASLWDFARKRLLRIAPALVVSTVLVAYVLCPPFSTSGILGFVTDGAVLDRVIDIITLDTANFYFDNIEFYPRQNEADYFPGMANGVLWTIRLEVAGYCLIGILAAFGLLTTARQNWLFGLVAAATASAVFLLPQATSEWVAQFLFVMPSLGCGILMNWLVHRHRPRAWLAMIFLVALVPATIFGDLPTLFPFLFAYPLIWMGAATFNPLPRFYAGTDISYGVYLYGWPLTQLIRHFVGPGLSGYELAALALPVTALAAWLSWRFVEKPALKMKPKPNEGAGVPAKAALESSAGTTQSS